MKNLTRNEKMWLNTALKSAAFYAATIAVIHVLGRPTGEEED